MVGSSHYLFKQITHILVICSAITLQNVFILQNVKGAVLWSWYMLDVDVYGVNKFLHDCCCIVNCWSQAVYGALYVYACLLLLSLAELMSHIFSRFWLFYCFSVWQSVLECAQWVQICQSWPNVWWDNPAKSFRYFLVIWLNTLDKLLACKSAFELT